MIDPAVHQLQHRQRVLAILAALEAAASPPPPPSRPGKTNTPAGGQPLSAIASSTPQLSPPAAAWLPPPLSACHAEAPGPDGIRHGLVARVRAAIAAGYYDDPAIWLAAETALLDAVTQPPSSQR
ncbi:MAG: hypothetical protein RMJ88_12930 [Thermogemmata sp.]|nr:hypothetical protein [Thermogemmata sp.]